MFKIEGTTISLTRGDSAEFDIEVYDSDGNLYELADGDKLEFTVKDNIHMKTPVIYKTGSQIRLVPKDTKSLSYKKYVYDVQLTLNDGTVDTIIPPSSFNVLSEVTF